MRHFGDSCLFEWPTDGALYRLFGFFFGSTLTGAGIYYYVLDEYKLSNELLTEDIYVSTLHLQPSITASTGVEAVAEHTVRGRANFTPQSMQSAVQRVHEYVQTLEEKVDELEKRKK